MMTLLLSLALAAASSDPASAAAPGATAAQPAKPVKPKKVCERIESTGSSVPKKVCRTVKPKAETDAANTVAAVPTGTATN
ncbi:hypothetical protein [Sphingopyxis sp. PET50]|uniref:hypothetical protein n=1 Tax=Sphingopyxis sp. PET50 TaxID=2976533 RepID=UPI0021B073B6|nr:hypothetical protein [Sphingopyxis sp. PET50]